MAESGSGLNEDLCAEFAAALHELEVYVIGVEVDRDTRVIRFRYVPARRDDSDTTATLLSAYAGAEGQGLNSERLEVVAYPSADSTTVWKTYYARAKWVHQTERGELTQKQALDNVFDTTRIHNR